MRRLPGLAALVCVLGSAAAQAPREADLPGPFHPYNVTGKHEGKFHSFVTAHDLDPAVLLFVNDVFANDAKDDAKLKDDDKLKWLATLLKRLDNAVEKNRNARLAVFVVFLDDAKLKDVVTNDEEREARAKTLKAEWQKEGLKHVVFALDSKAHLAKYKLDDKADVTALLYRRYKVLARHDLPKAGLTDDAIKEIMREAKEYLGAVKE
jgi:hypothetical protein